MRKLRWLLLIAIAVTAALLVTYRAEVARWAMARAAADNMATNAMAELPDGLHLAVCGAGAPMPDPERSGPCLAVVAGERLFVVDAGSGGARNLQRMGFAPGAVDALLLTHFHSDHIDGLGELAMLRWTMGTHDSPLPVHGPAGVEQVVTGFNTAYALDAEYRTAHHGAQVAPPDGAGLRALPFPLPAAADAVPLIEDGELTVHVFAVDHSPVTPAVGYRFDYRGRSLVISGDTGPTQAVARAARGTDLLVHEALSAELVTVLNRAAQQAGRSNLARITHDILDYHTTPRQAAAIAAEAGAGHLLLYHIVPPLPLPGLASAFLDGVAEEYPGPVTLARDGTFVSLPAGSAATETGRRL